MVFFFAVKADTRSAEPAQDALVVSHYQLEMPKVEVEEIKAENERLRPRPHGHPNIAQNMDLEHVYYVLRS